MTIILLPVTNGLYGNYGPRCLALVDRDPQPATSDRSLLAGALFPLLLLLSGTALAAVARNLRNIFGCSPSAACWRIGSLAAASAA